MADTLWALVEKIRTDRHLTNVALAEAMGVQPSQFYKWKRDNNDASVDFLQKVRTFTEDPDKFLTKAGDTLESAPRPAKTKRTTNVSFTLDMLKAISGIPSADLDYVVKVVEVIGGSSISIEKIQQLIELRDHEPTTK